MVWKEVDKAIITSRRVKLGRLGREKHHTEPKTQKSEEVGVREMLPLPPEAMALSWNIQELSHSD